MVTNYGSNVSIRVFIFTLLIPIMSAFTNSNSFPMNSDKSINDTNENPINSDGYLINSDDCLEITAPHNPVECRTLTINKLLEQFEMCDVAGRLSTIEHEISLLKCKLCPMCGLAFLDEYYRVIPCLCRMHIGCLKRWVSETKNQRPRICPNVTCSTQIEDENDLWDIMHLREENICYKYGNDTNNNLVTVRQTSNTAYDSDDAENDVPNEDSPKRFMPRAKVPPQSPRRTTKGRMNHLRRNLTDGDIQVPRKK